VIMLGVIYGEYPLDRPPDAGDGIDPGGSQGQGEWPGRHNDGVSFLVTSVISGLLVAAGGMFYVVVLGMGVLAVSVAHLAFVRVADRPYDEAARATVQATQCRPARHAAVGPRRTGIARPDWILLLQ
jgi:DHA3 family multidrug efflux protein-like MFS transporter